MELLSLSSVYSRILSVSLSGLELTVVQASFPHLQQPALASCVLGPPPHLLSSSLAIL